MPASSVRFGSFELDIDNGELRKAGIRIKLHDQPFRILTLLVQRPGEVVGREDLCRALWPGDTFVDFDHSLNSAVNKLREVLGDSAASPRYVETVPRRGYRFVAPVQVLAPEEPQIKEPPSPPPPSPTPTKRTLWAVGAAVVVIGAVVLGDGILRGPKEELLPPIPLTAYPGREKHPDFSPDGSQLAFAWDGTTGDNYDIYVKLVGQQQPLRLTTDPKTDFSPAWSPDGQWIAFAREDTDSQKISILMMPPVGGPERKLAEIQMRATHSRVLDWLPDSRTLVISDESGPSQLALWTLSTQTRARRRLTNPPPGLRDSDPAVSPDGRNLAFTRAAQIVSDVFRIPLLPDFSPAGAEIRLTDDRQASSSHPAWTADSRSIVVASGPQHRRSLWRLDASGSSQAELLYPDEKAMEPAIAGTRPRLAFSRTNFDVNIWRMPLTADSKALAGGSPVQLTDWTSVEHLPEFSPDGRHVAFISSQSGYQEVWISDDHGRGAMQITSFNGPEVNYVRWSPDGKSIVFSVHGQQQSGVYVQKLDAGTPHLLVDAGSHPSWSRDGKWVYFAARGEGTGQVRKIRVDGQGDWVLVAKSGGMAVESPDGKYLYFIKTGQPESLWRMPTSGGPETLIASPASVNFSPVEDGVFFTPHVGQRSTIAFWNAATRKTSTLLWPDRAMFWGLSASPDQRSLLYVQLDRFERDLMLVEGFR